jgi:TPR repeat protein
MFINNLLKRLIGSLILTFALVSHCSFANFDDAMKLYQKGDYENAFAQLRTLAEIGYYPAQFNLGVMYASGQHVKRDDIQAYAWMKLTEGKLEAMDQRTQEFYQGFSAEAKLAADNRAEEIMSIFGDDALAKSLLPSPLADADCTPPVRAISYAQPNYPSAALRRGNIAVVLVTFDVDKNGRVISPAIIFGQEQFHKPTIEAMLKAKFPAGQPANGLVNRVHYALANSSQKEGSYLSDLVGKIRKEADEGGSAMQKFSYAANTAHMAKKRPEDQVLNQYIIDAAQQGLPQAQFLIGRNLLYGRGCEVDLMKGLEWLRRSAQSSYAPAQHLLATKTFADKRHRKTSMLWLENAANSKHQPAMLKLAWILATSPDADVLNPERALKLASAANKKPADKITAFDTLAAAYAANGHFKAAIKLEKKAIRQAKRLKWSLPALHNRLTSFEQGVAWVDYENH